MDENSPAWSPDGRWIAVVRRQWGSNAPVRGDQIWLMEADGSNAQPVTQDQGVFHGQPVWSPDGRYLLYDNWGGASGIQSEIRLTDIDSGESRTVPTSGRSPAWLLKTED
jgi:Tol biopolymer transport system component